VNNFEWVLCVSDGLLNEASFVCDTYDRLPIRNLHWFEKNLLPISVCSSNGLSRRGELGQLRLEVKLVYSERFVRIIVQSMDKWIGAKWCNSLSKLLYYNFKRNYKIVDLRFTCGEFWERSSVLYHSNDE
jgi:hypothetical protein